MAFRNLEFMYPTQLHSYLLWRSTVDPDFQTIASRRRTAAISLLPATMTGVFVFGWYAGCLIAATLTAAFVTDFICHRFICRDSVGTRDAIWLFTGLILALMVPPNAPVWLPVAGVVLAIIAGKHYFSVDGVSLLQPAALGLLILHLLGLGAAAFSSGNPMLATRGGRSEWPVLSRSVESPASNKAMLLGFFGGDIRKSVTRQEYMDAIYKGQLAYCDKEKTVSAEAFHGPRPIDLVKAAPGRPSGSLENPVHYSAGDMLWGHVSGTAGGSSVLALGAGILLLVFSGAASWALPAAALLSMFAMLHLFAWLQGGGNPSVIPANIPVHMLTGGTLMGVFYLAGDPGTAPRSFMGKVCAGAALGVIEVLLRLFTPLTEGLFISVLLVQLLAFVIDQWLAPPSERARNTSSAGLTTSSLGRL